MSEGKCMLCGQGIQPAPEKPSVPTAKGVRAAMEEASKRYGAGPEGTFNLCCFSEALTAQYGGMDPVDGHLCRVILADRDDVEMCSPGNSHFRIKKPSADRKVTTFAVQRFAKAEGLEEPARVRLAIAETADIRDNVDRETAGLREENARLRAQLIDAKAANREQRMKGVYDVLLWLKDAPQKSPISEAVANIEMNIERGRLPRGEVLRDGEPAPKQERAPEKTVNVLVKGFAGGDYKTKADEEFCRTAESLREPAQQRLTDAELWKLAQDARPIAKRGSTMHPLWEVIFDAESHAKGEPEKAIMKDRDRIAEILQASIQREAERG